MKTEVTRLPEPLADDLATIAKAHRMPKARLIELAIEKLVAEVRETGRLPLPPVEPGALSSAG